MKRKIVKKNNHYRFEYRLTRAEKITLAFCILIVAYMIGRISIYFILGV